MELSTTSYDSNVGKSCDTQSHQPIRSEESDSQSVARQSAIGSGIEREGEGQGEGPVVNEEAIHQTMEMSQRLNIDTLSKSHSLSLSILASTCILVCYGVYANFHFQFWAPTCISVCYGVRIRVTILVYSIPGNIGGRKIL